MSRYLINAIVMTIFVVKVDNLSFRSEWSHESEMIKEKVKLFEFSIIIARFLNQLVILPSKVQ